MIKWIKYEESMRCAWNEICQESGLEIFLFERDYMEYHKHRFHDASMMCLHNGHPKAVFLANINDKECTITSHGGLTYGGVIFRSSIKSSPRLEYLDQLLKKLKSEYAGYNLIYKSIPVHFFQQPNQSDIYLLWRMGAEILKRDFNTTISLYKAPKYSKGKKANIKKARATGLNVVEFDNASEIYKLLFDTLKRRHGSAPVHSCEELDLLKQKFNNKILFMGANLFDKVHAMTVIYKYGKIWHTQYMANDEFGMKHGALDFLIDHVIELASQHSVKLLNFGISTEQGGKILNSGLLSQKEMFNGFSTVVDTYHISL